jgi:hypothetical protein
MKRIPITGMVVLSLALIAAAGAALDVGSLWVQPVPPPVEHKAATLMPAILPSSSDAKDQGLATTSDQAALQSLPPADDELGFDIARIEPSGDAVIAGRATPGASVELLRSGEVHDRVVADPSGQFVMVPHRLPPGDYELTLRSRQDDGKSATSKEKVLVSLAASLAERPVVTLVAPTGSRTELSKPLTSARRSALRGSTHLTGLRHSIHSHVAASHFRNAYGRYRGDGYGEYLYSGYEYGYRCWVPGPYGRSSDICY